MIVVKVELWPGGLASRARELTRLYIGKDGKTSTSTRGNYDVAVMRRGETKPPWPIGWGGNPTAKPIRSGRVEGHARKALHVLTLVGKAIEACFPPRLPKSKEAKETP